MIQFFKKGSILDKKDKESYIIGTLSDSLRLLDQFLYDSPEIGVTELSKKTKLHKNKVFRILATFEKFNYIEQNKDTEQYRLGIKLLQLGQSYLKKSGINIIAEPFLESLNKDLQETVYLSLFSGQDAVCINVKEAPSRIKVSIHIGEHFPLHANAMGKLLSAKIYENKKHLDFIKNMELLTTNTIDDKKILENQIKNIIKNNIATDKEEWEKRVINIASPIRDFSYKWIGGIGVSIPLVNYDEKKTDIIIAKLKKMANELSFKLGFPYIEK